MSEFKYTKAVLVRFTVLLEHQEFTKLQKQIIYTENRIT